MKLTSVFFMFLTLFAECCSAYDFSLNVPSSIASDKCQKVSGGDTFKNVTLYKTFDGDIKNFKLYTGKWSPHYDGGYDEVNRKWLGYDWVVKRTLAESKEQQIYVDPLYKGKSNTPLGLNPFSIQGGNLHITADVIPPNDNWALPGFSFYSGLLTTRTSFLQMYGYFEIEAIVPEEPYLVPAFWLLPFDKSWPPEIDVFEAPGHEPGTIITTLHSKDVSGKHLQSGCRIPFPGFNKAFHRYGVLWLPDKLVYFIDRVPVTMISAHYSLNKPMYMLLNLAVGGNWVGIKPDLKGIPVSMVVKDVAAYSLAKSPTCFSSQGGVLQCMGM